MRIVARLARQTRPAARRTISVLAAALLLAGAIGAASAFGTTPVGPPFPQPEIDRAVYDFAGILGADTIATAETTIDAIERRTGVEIVIYTQVLGYKPPYEETESRAVNLMNQWGVGQRGIDNGLVIFFDLDVSKLHGMVSLYAGSGFRAAYLSDDERQAIFDDAMLPRLRDGDFDGAIRAALIRIDEAATEEHANELLRARQFNAVIGIVGGGIALFGLVGWVSLRWWQTGRDPVVAQSESILMPAPPNKMTPTMATLVLDGAVSRRTLTTALLDLASRGRLAFEERKGPLGIGRKLAVHLGSRARDTALTAVAASEAERTGAADDDQRSAIAEARLSLAERAYLGEAEGFLRRELASLGEDETIDPEDLPLLAEDIPEFEQRVEDQAVAERWFGIRPSQVVGRWRVIAAVEFIGGVLQIVAGMAIPMSGLTLLGAACVVAGIVTFAAAGVMPARTKAGALQRVWLEAYKRTLARTMDQARSMDQVVTEAKLDWLDTPDRAVVWATALGLGGAVEEVLARTMHDTREAGTRTGYLPVWYRGSDGTSLASAAVAGGGGGLFSGSGMPDIGGMFATMGTIGNPPSSSGSGGGGGGFGGGGGGGGGGAGGGF